MSACGMKPKSFWDHLISFFLKILFIQGTPARSLCSSTTKDHKCFFETQGTDMRGQKQCQDFLWLFFRSLPLDYNRKMQISRAHTVSTNFSHSPAPAGWGALAAQTLCDSSAQRAAEQPENTTVLAEMCVYKYSLSHRLEYSTEWWQKQVPAPGQSIGSDFAWSRVCSHSPAPTKHFFSSFYFLAVNKTQSIKAPGYTNKYFLPTKGTFWHVSNPSGSRWAILEALGFPEVPVVSITAATPCSHIPQWFANKQVHVFHYLIRV